MGWIIIRKPQGSWKPGGMNWCKSMTVEQVMEELEGYLRILRDMTEEERRKLNEMHSKTSLNIGNLVDERCKCPRCGERDADLLIPLGGEGDIDHLKELRAESEGPYEKMDAYCIKCNLAYLFRF